MIYQLVFRYSYYTFDVLPLTILLDRSWVRLFQARPLELEWPLGNSVIIRIKYVEYIDIILMMDYHARLHHSIAWHGIAWHSIPYHTIPYHTIPYHTIPYHTIPYHTIPYQTIHHTRSDHTPCQTIPYRTAPHRTAPDHTTPHHTTPRHTTPHHTIPYHTTPYHTIPDPYHSPTPTHTTYHPLPGEANVMVHYSLVWLTRHSLKLFLLIPVLESSSFHQAVSCTILWTKSATKQYPF